MIVRNTAALLHQSVKLLRIKSSMADVDQLCCHLMHRRLMRLVCHKARYGANISQISPLLSGIKHDHEFTVYNPASGESLCKVDCASPEVVNSAINNAQAVFESGIWSKAPAMYRSKVLSGLARLLEERIPDFAKLETLQTGRTIREMNAQLGRLPEWL